MPRGANIMTTLRIFVAELVEALPIAISTRCLYRRERNEITPFDVLYYYLHEKPKLRLIRNLLLPIHVFDNSVTFF